MRRLLARARGASWESVRTRIAPLVAALALAAPLVGLVTSDADPIDGQAESPAHGERADPSEPSQEADGVEGSARGTSASAKDGGAVGRAWAAAAVARRSEDAAEEFAKRFGISVELAEEIHDAALEEEIDPKVAFGLVRTESSFRRTVVSWAGAVGYTQLLPSTARWIAPGTARGELFDTRTNLRVGFRYLRYLLDKYDGDTRLALLAYNRGPGTVDGILRRGGNPGNGYAQKVLRGAG